MSALCLSLPFPAIQVRPHIYYEMLRLVWTPLCHGYGPCVPNEAVLLTIATTLLSSSGSSGSSSEKGEQRLQLQYLQPASADQTEFVWQDSELATETTEDDRSTAAAATMAAYWVRCLQLTLLEHSPEVDLAKLATTFMVYQSHSTMATWPNKTAFMAQAQLPKGSLLVVLSEGDSAEEEQLKSSLDNWSLVKRHELPTLPTAKVVVAGVYIKE